VEPAWRASERARCGVTEPTTESRIKVTGLAVMGANLARNIARYYRSNSQDLWMKIF